MCVCVCVCVCVSFLVQVELSGRDGGEGEKRDSGRDEPGSPPLCSRVTDRVPPSSIFEVPAHLR